MFKTAVITAVEGNRVRVIFSGESQASLLTYPTVKGSNPSLGERALMAKVGSSYICIGVIQA